ncbi:nose resistant to fluoxetine protein 6-like [Galendromus occidentalis]|uniref:Nose resistant to fluoxetine protein 6-like n=1 Tax=Galendromus occidentalis TaxID=34638 RepID=A0AAJ6QR34_9ACAR|nr:nose resistant to fluoxetine protein 6-like [Galendromus occidentalis]
MKINVILVFGTALLVPTLAAVVPGLPPKKQAVLKVMRKLGQDIGSRLQPIFEELLVDTNVTNNCIGSLVRTMAAARENEEWALRILLSSGSLPTSILDGGLASYGSFDQCRRARRYNSEGHLAFRGQWCAVTILPDDDIVEHIRLFSPFKEFLVRAPGQDRIIPKNLREWHIGIKIGVCVPSSCNQDELHYIVNKALMAYDISAVVSGCQTDETIALSTAQKISLTYVLITAALLIVGTFLDWKIERGDKESKTVIEVLSFFSIRRNTARLLKDPKDENGSLQFMSGLKVLLSFWAVVGHTHCFLQPDMLENLHDGSEAIKSWIFQPILNAFMAVEASFFISGFLLGYLTIVNQEKIRNACRGRHISVIYSTVFLRRYVRTMLPALAMLAYSFLIPLLYDSPIAIDSMLAAYVGNCPNNWWKLPLLLGNTDSVSELCAIHTWYLAVDMQIFALGSAFALLLVFRPKIALGLSGILCVVAAMSTAYITYIMNFAYIIMFQDFDFERVFRTLDYVYIQAYPHLPNYFLGLICGYFSARNPRTFLSLRIRIVMWLISTLIASYVVFGTAIWFKYGFPEHLPGSIYAGFHRPLWGLAMMWLTYANTTGRGGIVNEMLSHRIFTICGRLTYGIYLMHMIVISVKNGYLKGSVLYTNQFLVLKDALGIFVMSIFLAYYLNISIEAPFAAMDDMIFGERRTATSRKQPPALKGSDDKRHVISIRQDTPHTKM